MLRKLTIALALAALLAGCDGADQSLKADMQPAGGAQPLSGQMVPAAAPLSGETKAVSQGLVGYATAQP